MTEYERYRASQVASWLRHISSLDAKIRNLASEIAARRMMAEGVSAIAYDGMPKGSGAAGDALANAVAKIEELNAELVSELESYRREVREATDALMSLDDPLEYGCVYLRHIKRMRWRDVARDVGYSEQHVREVCQAALSRLWDRMPHEWRDPMHRAL